VRPDQTEIRAIIERHIGTPADLYRFSVNPDSGEVTLSFHFPAVARQQYGAALEAAAQEAGVTITTAPQPHQGALTDAAAAALPEGLRVLKVSVHHPRHAIALRCEGEADPAALEAARDTFHERTGWTLEIEGVAGDQSAPAQAAPARADALNMHDAMTTVRGAFDASSGLYKVSADQGRQVLTLRFHFPDIARERYADLLASLVEQTGWQITVYPQPHQGELDAQARRVLPPELSMTGGSSLYSSERQVVVRCKGTANEQSLATAEQEFAAATGWNLIIRQE
jgi:hypothetical protein